MKSLWMVLLVCFCASCGGEKKKTGAYQYELEATGTVKKIPLDSDVRYNAFYLYTFSDDAGKEYLSFLNYRSNQILFYDFEKSEFLFKINLYAEGPNGVVQPSGFYIKDFDNISLVSLKNG